jgi:hypothetical protein
LAGLICAAGRQNRDWSGDYRLFSRDRWEPEDLFIPVVRGALQLLPEDAPLVTALDDTRLPKTGRKIPGVAYGRDPMSPAFHVNLVPGQRFVQLSALVATGSPPAPARGVPVRFHHQPPVAKPKAGAGANEIAAYREARRLHNLSTCGRDLISQLRRELDERHQATRRELIVSGDGSYTNKTVLGGLPERTTFIGRVRKDAKLHHPPRPDQQPRVGSKRRYGDVAPTPEQLRRDEGVPWRSIAAHASGKTHTFRVKEMRPLLWRKAGVNLPVRLLVIAPVGYRLHKDGRLLYKQPAYLLTTDLERPADEIVQYYLWRWDIEVNHRDEKQLIGVGQAQVWSPQSVERQPALAVASYAYVLMAALRIWGLDDHGPALPIPKWQTSHATPRLSTQRILQTLRSEIWAYALERLEPNSCNFAATPTVDTKSQESEFPLDAAVISARAG